MGQMMMHALPKAFQCNQPSKDCCMQALSHSNVLSHKAEGIDFIILMEF